MKFKINDVVYDKDLPAFIGKIRKIGSIKFGRKDIPALIVNCLGSGKEEIMFQEDAINLTRPIE